MRISVFELHCNIKGNSNTALEKKPEAQSPERQMTSYHGMEGGLPPMMYFFLEEDPVGKLRCRDPSEELQE